MRRRDHEVRREKAGLGRGICSRGLTVECASKENLSIDELDLH